MQKLRTLDLFKNPGVAETIDWATALTELDRLALDPETISDTIGTLLKYQDDIARIHGGEGARVLTEVKDELRAARLRIENATGAGWDRRSAAAGRGALCRQYRLLRQGAP